MKWEIRVYTELGSFQLSLNGYFKTKKDAERIVELAKLNKEVKRVDIIKR